MHRVSDGVSLHKLHTLLVPITRSPPRHRPSFSIQCTRVARGLLSTGPSPPQASIVEQLALILASRPGWSHVEAVTKARVPLVRCIDTASSIPADISVDNQWARVKTMLLASYSRCDPRVRQLMFVVKRWAHRRAVNEPRNNFPNSYAWCQLVIAYLQACAPPVLPALTSLSGGAWTDAWYEDPLALLPALEGATDDPSGDAEREAARVALTLDQASVIAAAAMVAAAEPAPASVGQLLLGFFRFWLAWVGGGKQSGAKLWVVCTRLGAPISQAKKSWPENAVGEDYHLWPIEDPGETPLQPSPRRQRPGRGDRCWQARRSRRSATARWDDV